MKPTNQTTLISISYIKANLRCSLDPYIKVKRSEHKHL